MLKFRAKIKLFKTKEPGFFYLYVIVFVLYISQLALRIEITPLGYFSLYSNPMSIQSFYSQNLPFNNKNNQAIDIYNQSTSLFLPLEILPTRYENLSQAPNDNPLSQKLNQLGIKINTKDSLEYGKFKLWYYNYCIQQNIKLPDYKDFDIKHCNFKNGQLLNSYFLK